MQGDAEFAQEISFLARHLAGTWKRTSRASWATSPRIAWPTGARSLAGWGRAGRAAPAQGAAEYWTEESPLIASRVKVEGFIRDVAELRDAVERLGKRIDRM